MPSYSLFSTWERSPYYFGSFSFFLMKAQNLLFLNKGKQTHLPCEVANSNRALLFLHQILSLKIKVLHGVIYP